MTLVDNSLPFKTIHDIKLTGEEMEAVEKDSLCNDWITDKYQPDTENYDNGVFAMFAKRLDKAIALKNTSCSHSHIVGDSFSSDKISCKSCISFKNLCIIAQRLINVYTTISTDVNPLPLGIGMQPTFPLNSTNVFRFT